MLLIPFHVLAGAIAIVSGLLALFAPKGRSLHRGSGTVFVASMLVMALSGVVMTVGRYGATVNIPAGLVTAYLVTTARLTVRTPSARSRQLERAAMAAAFALGLVSLVAAIVAARQGQPGFAIPALMFGVI